MLRCLSTTAGIVCVILASPAPAQEAPDQGGEPATAGFRIEALLGAERVGGFEHGALYGGRIGYDLRVAPNLLLGVDAELNDVTTDQELAGSPIVADDRVLDDGPDFYVGGRMSLMLSRRFRIHGALGLTRARQSSFFLIDPNQPLGPIGGEESYRSGYRASIGGQLSIGRRAFLGAEYRYSDYGERFVTRNQLVGSIGFRF